MLPQVHLAQRTVAPCTFIKMIASPPYVAQDEFPWRAFSAMSKVLYAILDEKSEQKLTSSDEESFAEEEGGGRHDASGRRS